MSDIGVTHQSNVIQTPFTKEQVRNLKIWQEAYWVHPYTCPNRGDGQHTDVKDRDLGTLEVSVDGLRCPDCDYTQLWAYRFKLPQNPFKV